MITTFDNFINFKPLLLSAFLALEKRRGKLYPPLRYPEFSLSEQEQHDAEEPKKGLSIFSIPF